MAHICLNYHFCLFEKILTKSRARLLGKKRAADDLQLIHRFIVKVVNIELVNIVNSELRELEES